MVNQTLKMVVLISSVLCAGVANAAISSSKNKLPSILPVDEPISYYGNPISYRNDGKTYHVLKSSRGFRQKGLASWYGADFHRKRTSNGEIYDMYGISAAHKTLPLPSYVKVTNLSNGRSIIVRVNDRGPFHSDRVIDLSYAAASQLGFVHLGTAKVSIEAVSLADYQAPQGEYFVQVASLSMVGNAKRLKRRLEKEFNWPVVLGRISDLYTIAVGPFDQLDKINQVRYQLAQIGFDGAFPVIR